VKNVRERYAGDYCYKESQHRCHGSEQGARRSTRF
jgi:hypothetical protein